jgi:hypothetical protein
MKNTITYFLLCFLFTTSVYAKKETPSLVAHTNVQFIENKGQITDQYGVVRRDIDVKIEANGVTMFVGDGELHYQWVAAQSQNSNPDSYRDKTQKNPISKIENQESEIQIYRMDVKLVGANKNAQVIFEEPTGYYENYYLAHTGENGVRANGFQRVAYKDIYPNIDLVFYTAGVSGPRPAVGVNASAPPPARTSPPPPAGDMHKVSSPLGEIEGQNPSGIKYDFVVHPGGNPADIRLRYEGATEMKLVDGSLVATTPYGSITEAAPYSYEQMSDKEVASAYVLKGNELSFSTGAYTGTLVIDPVLKWGTYYGTDMHHLGMGICVDLYEHVYLCGETSAASNIATTGTHKSTITPGYDGYIVKLDSSGARLWGSYYGGPGNDYFSSVTCDKAGNLYAAGICDTGSSKTGGMASSGAHQTTYGGGNDDDAFLVRFNPANGQRLWATLYGGSDREINAALVTDKSGNVFMAGGTQSSNNIATTGTHKSNKLFIDGMDGYIVKFNNSGARQWGTYNGGSGFDYFISITCNSAGDVYAVGAANSTTGIASTGAHQGNLGGNVDGFVTKINGSNGSRQWGTYYGGSNLDVTTAVCVDKDDNLYIGGSANSTSNIATTGVYRSVSSGGNDAFIARFTSSGTRLWGSYYGGINAQSGVSGMEAGSNGDIYITGCVSATTGVATTGAHQASYGGGNHDAYLAVFTGGMLDYGTYYGGSDHELHNPYSEDSYGHCLALSNAGRVYIAGLTRSSNNIATSGTHQSSYVGTNALNAFLAAFETDTVVFIPQRYTDTVWCPGDTVRIVYGVNQPFRTGNAFTVELSNATGGFTSPVNIGSHNANTGDTITCVIPMSTPAGTGYRIRIIADSPGRISWDNQWDIRINPLPANLVAGSNSPVCTGDSLQLTGSSTNTGITWLWSGPNNFISGAKDSFIANAQLIDSGNYILKATLNSTGCSLTDTTTVEMRPRPDKPTAGSNSPVCEFYSVQLTTSSSTNGVSYTWNGPGSYNSSTQNPTVTTSALSTHAGDYISTATLNGCSNRDTTTVVVLPKPPTPTAGATNSPLCARQDLQLTASTVTGASYAWYGPSAFTANVQNPVRANVQMGDAGTYYVYATVSGCVSDTDSVVVTVNTDPFVNIFPTPGASICQGQQAIFTAVPTNGGTTSYNWLVNGITTGSTGTTYSTTTLNNGDAVSCAMTSTGTCATPFIDTSNAITMTVQPILTPTVTMTADKMPPWNGGLTVTFTANPTHGGTTPEYQWKRNGQDITGATGATWGVIVNALNDNEDICVVLKSSYECAVPDTAMSNCITTAFTGIVGEATNNGFKIYPNPVSGILHIEGVEAGSTIELIDVLGRKCAISQLLNGSIDVSMLVPGVYVVRVNGVVEGRVVKE